MGVFGFQLAKTKSSYIYKTERLMNEVGDFLYFPSLSSTSRQHAGARHRSREADLMPCAKVKEQKKPNPIMWESQSRYIPVQLRLSEV